MVFGRDCRGPLLPGAKGLAPSSEACPLVWTGPCLLKGPDAGISSFWLKDVLSKQEEEEPCPVEISKIDDALLEEALRYGTASSPFRLLVPIAFSSPLFYFWSDSFEGVLRLFWGWLGGNPEGISVLHCQWTGVYRAGGNN